MACNVILCFVTLLTLQRTKLRYRPQKARGGQAERAGVRMEARRAKTNALRVGLVYDSHPRPGARPKPYDS